MVGVIIVTHVQLAQEFLKIAQLITGNTLDNFKTVSIPMKHVINCYKL